METRNPTLTLTYLPHLDYNLQRLGPDLEHPDRALCHGLADHPFSRAGAGIGRHGHVAAVGLWWAIADPARAGRVAGAGLGHPVVGFVDWHPN